MPDYRDLLRPVGALSLLEAKASQVQEKVAVKSDQIGSKEYGDDWDVLDDASFATKYGTAAMLKRDNARYRANREKAIAESDRIGMELPNDLTAAAVKGAYRLAAGAARLGTEASPGAAIERLAKTGILGDRAEQVAREQEADRAELFLAGERNIVDPITRTQSDVSQLNARDVARQTAADAAQNKVERDQAVAGGRNELVADAQRFFKDFGDGFGNTISNPTTLADTSAEQLPTLLLGPAARAVATEGAVAARASAVASRMGGEQGITQALMAEARETLQGRAMGALVGATEAGSAYNDQSNQILETPIEELAARFPDVAEQLAAGADPRLVRAELANRTAGKTAALVAPVAAVAGRLTSAFELDPLSMGAGTLTHRAGTIAGRVAGEMAEESVQGASSEIAGNLVERQEGDTSGDLLDGAGTAAGQGAAAALGFSGGLQAPAVAKIGGELAWEGTKAAARPIGKALAARAEAAQAAEQAQVEEARQVGVQARGQDLAQVATGIEAAVNDTTSATPAAAALVEPLESEPLLSRETSAVLAGESAPTNRVEALGRALDVIHQMNQVPEADRDEEHDNRSGEIELFALKTGRQLRERLAEVGAETDEGRAIQRTLLNPEMTALEESVQGIPEEELQGLLDTVQGTPDFATPQSQQAAEKLLTIAEVAPEKISSAAAQSVALYQRLTPNQKAHLQTVAQVAQVREEHAARSQAIGQPDGKTVDIVREEVREKGMSKSRPSLLQYQNAIQTAMQRGNLATAAQHMRSLLHFARHFDGKAKAFDAALVKSQALFAAGKRGHDTVVDLPYDMVDVHGKKVGGKAYAWIEKQGAVNLVGHIANDATAVAELYNTLAAAYGDQLVNTDVNRSAPTPLVASVSIPSAPSITTAETTNAPAAPGSTAAAPVDDTASNEDEEVANADAPVDNAADESSNGEQDEEADAAADEGAVDNAVADKRTLDDALDLTEDQYIAAVNPDGKVTDAEELAEFEKTGLDARDVPADVEELGTRTDRKGNTVRMVRAQNGDLFVLEADGTPVASLVDAGGGQQMSYVVPSARGRGLGVMVTKQRIQDKPFAQSGGFSEAGEAVRRSAFRELKEERELDRQPDAQPDDRAHNFESLPAHPDGSPNWFLSSFQLRAGAQSLLARVPGGLNTLARALKAAGRGQMSALTELLLPEHQAVTKITAEQVQALTSVVTKILPEVIKQLNANLERSLGQGLRFDPVDGWVPRLDNKGKVKGGWLEALVDGRATLTPGQYSLSTLEYGRDENGNAYVRYQNDIAQAMALASVSWVLEQAGAPINFSEEDLAAMFPEGMSPALRDAFATKHFAVQPVRTIAQSIIRQLGMQGQKDASVTLTDGIAKSLALDALTALHDADVIRIHQEKGTENDGNKTLSFIDLRDHAGAKIMKDLGKGVGSVLLNRLLDPEGKTLPTFEPSKAVPSKVSGTNQNLSGKQRQAVERQNAVPFYRNGPLILFKELMGDAFLELIGLDEKTDLTAQHADFARTIDGKNQGLRYAEARVRDLDTMIFDRAGDASTAENTALYWSHYVVSNGRVMQDGFGGQGDKWAREAISANKRTVDLSSDRTAHAKDHYLAMAQALGLKTEKLRNTVAIAQIQTMLGSADTQAVLASIQALLKTQDGEAAAALKPQIEALAKAHKFELTAKALHALVTHARLLEAREAGTANEFTTYLAFELDGKTNGPFNALVHFGLTALGPKIYNQLAKGGLFVGNTKPMTLSRAFEEDKNFGDLYQDAADLLQTRLVDEIATRPRDSRESVMLRSGMTLLSLAGHIKPGETPQSFVVLRGIAKAALMTTTYGAGRRGVVNAMAHEVMAALVKHLSDVATGKAAKDDGVLASMSQLMSQRWVKDLGWVATPALDMTSPATIVFTPEHFQALVDNLLGGQKLYDEGQIVLEEADGAGGLLRNIVESEMAPVLRTFGHVMNATKFQMMVFKRRYAAAYEARRQELIALPDGDPNKLNKYHALSRSEEAKLLESLKDVMPAYALPMTGDGMQQEGVFAGAKNYNGEFVVNGKPYQAESIGFGMRADLNVQSFEDPGVKAAPLLTIGAGDATMMNILSALMDGTLNVYDGWEVSVGQITSHALAANEAVRKSLEFDLIGGVEKTFSRISAEDVAAEIQAMGQAELEAFAKTLKIYPKKKGPSIQERVLEEYLRTRNGLAKSGEAIRENKQEIFKRQPNSIDQMSGGENPSVRGFTTEQLQERPAPGPVEGESQELITRLGEDYQNGLARLDKFELDILLSTFPFTDKVRKFVVERIQHLLADDLQVFVGTRAEIQAKQRELHPLEDMGDAPGMFIDNTIYLTVASEETLVHELVHAATFHLIRRYYAGVKGLTAAQKDAVRELEAMLEPFLKLTGSEALGHAQAEVRGLMRKGQTAAAINEMLAWSLANSAISNQLEQTESPGVLKKVAKTIRALVRKLLGLPNNAAMDTFLDQMASNFQRIVRRPRLAETSSALALFQRLSTGLMGGPHNLHLEATLRSFVPLLRQMDVRAADPAVSKLETRVERERLLLEAEKAVADLMDVGFQMNDREQFVFRIVQATLSSNLQLDPAILASLDQLYAQAAEKLDETAFVAPGTTDPIELQLGRERYAALFGDTRRTVDKYGRSQLLSNFVAMALSNQQLREALAQIEPAKPEKQGETFDERVRDFVRRAFDWMSDRSLGTGTPANQRIHLDRLAERLGQIQQQAQRQGAIGRTETLVDRLEGKVKTGMAKADAAIGDFLHNDTRLNDGVKGLIQGFRGLLTDESAEANAESLLQIATRPRVPQVFVDLMSELAGNTPTTVKVHMLLNKTRHAVSRVRQSLREEAPGDVRAFFKAPLSDAQWATLHRAVGNTDLQALSTYGTGRLAGLVSNASLRDQEIQTLLGQLGPNQALYEADAKELAEAMIDRSVGPRYRNAEALARLFGQAQVAEKQAKRLAPLLDRLVSLYALERLTDAERTELHGLMLADEAGMTKLLNTMRSLVHGEMGKSRLDQRLNRWKGWVPESRDPRSNVVLATPKQAADLVKRGYRKVGMYAKDSRDPANDLAYYAVDWVGGAATFNQGALQTVEGTLSGVDALTGQSLDPGVGTLIVNEGVVASIGAMKSSKSLLTPIYNPDGEVEAYERVLDPAVIARHVTGKKDLSLSIGIWLGRQAEETLADAMNGQVVDVLRQRWLADQKAGLTEMYVALNTSKDPVHADTWKAIPRHTQDMLTNAFPGGKVMVRRDMMRNAVGYRSASVADAFTGVSNLPEPVRKAIVNAVYALPGLDYKKLVVAEKAIQAAVGTAKDWIVVRSGTVAIANGVANMFQLVGSGINPLMLPKLIAQKARETELYLRNEKRLSQIRVELKANRRPDARNKLLLEQQRLLDANARLSIAPLVYAGELPTIAEGTTEVDQYTLTGDIQHWVEKQSERLPSGVLTALKIAAISKDTALYQGLNRLVQFGDFTAKAVLYDKWIQDGMAPEKALEKVSERFVNYNLNGGRARDYLESIGLLWFWNYKLRIQKVVLASIRENPLRFLTSVGGASLAGSDSLLSSSAPLTHWDYSIGPDQLFRAPDAPMWHQIF